ncbi:Nucleoporin [Podosphaera aphanis]|nr:Nucleoporin [Podosphaera aphanis]
MAFPISINSQLGPDILDIQTTELGFRAIYGESKVQLLPTPWPKENLPPSTSSLMSIASRRGILAAAGPDCVVLATTALVREAFEKSKPTDRQANPYSPNLTIPMKIRISHLAFSADEKYLILSAEDGGGLAVYEVSSLMTGATEATFELPTNGQALSCMIPNPALEREEFLAMVTKEGNLMIANLKERTFIIGAQGSVLKDRVSCISWSTKGKQIVAGLSNGCGYQMTPEGVCKAEIPRLPNLDADDYVSSILWLENHVFLFIYTPCIYDDNQAPRSSFYLVTRTSDLSNYSFQKIPDPAQPFGLNRSPPHHFMLRLMNFPPNLQDAIIIASTSSTDIGLLTRSKTPLTHDKPPERVSGIFTMTEMSEDSRRAQLPMSSKFGDTSPIGTALDLSSKDKVFQPIPGDEISESSTPLPGLMVLNNEGVLSCWWIIYCESIRQHTMYPGLAIAESCGKTNVRSPAPAPAPAVNALSNFGTSATAPSFGTPGFTSPSNSLQMMNRTAATFGTPTPLGGNGLFGPATTLGKQASPWSAPTALGASQGFAASPFGASPTPQTSNSVFQKPEFGKTNTSVFGQPSSLQSSWQSASQTSALSSFARAGEQKSVFGAPLSQTESGAQPLTGFAAFATKGGFAAAIGGLSASTDGQQTTKSPFNALTPNLGNSNIFGAPSEEKPTSFDGRGLEGVKNFVLGSTFKADPSTEHSGSQSDKSIGFFDRNFGGALINANASPSPQSPIDTKETEKKSVDMSSQPSNQFDSTTPTSTPIASRILSSTPSISFPHIARASNLTQTPLSFPSLSTSNLRQSSNNQVEPVHIEPLTGDKIEPGSLKAQPTQINDSIDMAEDGSFIKLEGENTLEVRSSNEHDLKASERLENVGELSEFGCSIEVIEREDPPSANVSQAIKRKHESFSPIKAHTQEDNFATSTDEKNQETFKADGANKSEASDEQKEEEIIHCTSADDADNIDESNKADDSEEFEEFGEANDDEDDYNSETKTDESSDEESDEGSGEDIGNDLSPVSETNHNIELSPNNSFKVIKKHSQGTNEFVESSSRSYGQETRMAMSQMELPSRIQEIPRSPSPMRGTAVDKFRSSEHSRSVSAPGFRARNQSSKRTNGISTRQAHDLYLISLEKQKAQEKRRNDLKEEREAEEKRRHELRIQKEAEEKQALVDQDDMCMQQFLASPPEPTTRLNEFIAHSDYVSGMTGDKIPAQVETVYRDINSMIDTLGLNARSLREFILGHTEGCIEKRTRDDLEEESSWVLGEIKSLSSILDNELSQELESGCVKDLAQKTSICNDLQKEVFKFRSRYNDIQKAIATFQDPDRLAIARLQPLGSKQIAQQQDLRRDFMRLQSLLSEAEEGLAVLKAKFVARDICDGKAGSTTKPTIEAILRTIAKLTNMAEKKSGDIDVLEGQIRKLSLRSPEGSKATPINYRASHRSSGTFRLLHSPDRMKDSPFQNSLICSPRRKLSGYTTEEKVQLRSKLAKKKQVLNRLKLTLQNTGVDVRLLGNDD